MQIKMVRHGDVVLVVAVVGVGAGGDGVGGGGVGGDAGALYSFHMYLRFHLFVVVAVVGDVGACVGSSSLHLPLGC